MGLDYSIKLYISNEKLNDALQWLSQNTWSDNNDHIFLKSNDNLNPIKGQYFWLNEINNKIQIGKTIEEFQQINFSSGLLFDMDPKIIEYLNDFETNSIENFKARFNNLVVNNEKIKIGNFAVCISKLENHPVIELKFTAVTSKMSRLIDSSIAVKKWLLDFSKDSNAILTYLDLETNGKRILFYAGHEIELIIKKGFNASFFNQANLFFRDFYDLEYDYKFENN